MPKLRDYMAPDLAMIFNLDEFAEIHNIDGNDMPVIVDTDILKERSSRIDGIYTGELVLFVRLSDLPGVTGPFGEVKGCGSGEPRNSSRYEKNFLHFLPLLPWTNLIKEVCKNDIC